MSNIKNPSVVDLVPHIIEDFCRLRRHYNQSLRNEDRVWRSSKLQKKSLNYLTNKTFVREIEIVNCKEPSLTPLKKLAVPVRRKLVDLQKEPPYINDFSKERRNTVKKLLSRTSQQQNGKLLQKSFKSSESNKEEDKLRKETARRVSFSRLATPNCSTIFKDKHTKRIISGADRNKQEVCRTRSKCNAVSERQHARPNVTSAYQLLQETCRKHSKCNAIFEGQHAKRIASGTHRNKQEGCRKRSKCNAMLEGQHAKRIASGADRNKQEGYRKRSKCNAMLEGQHAKRIASGADRNNQEAYRAYSEALKRHTSTEVFTRLSQPKTYSSPTPLKKPWKLTKTMRSYTPSKRLEKISAPKTALGPLSPYSKVKKSALLYRATPRISRLAVPTRLSAGAEVDPFKVSQNALHGTIPLRVISLAIPKKNVENANRKFPYRVTRKALNAEPTLRIQQLAEPKYPPSILARMRW